MKKLIASALLISSPVFAQTAAVPTPVSVDRLQAAISVLNGEKTACENVMIEGESKLTEALAQANAKTADLQKQIDALKDKYEPKPVGP